MTEEKKKSDGPINWIIDKTLSRLPKDPLTQTNFMYRLVGIIVASFFLFALERWYTFFTTLNLDSLFYGILLSCFFLMSLFNFKSLRDSYNLLKKQKPMENDLTPEQLEMDFKKEKKLTPEQERKLNQIEKDLDQFEEEVDNSAPKSKKETYPEDSFPAVIGRQNQKEAKAEAKEEIKKGNPWMEHVKKIRAENQGKALKEILKIAKMTYKK